MDCIVELTGMVGNFCATSKKFVQHLGSPVRINRSWMDIDYPYAPPPDYERSGLVYGISIVGHSDVLTVLQY